MRSALSRVWLLLRMEAHSWRRYSPECWSCSCQELCLLDLTRSLYLAERRLWKKDVSSPMKVSDWGSLSSCLSVPYCWFSNLEHEWRPTWLRLRNGIRLCHDPLEHNSEWHLDSLHELYLFLLLLLWMKWSDCLCCQSKSDLSSSLLSSFLSPIA